jgi:integrase
VCNWLLCVKQENALSQEIAKQRFASVKRFLLYLEDEGVIPPRAILWRRVPTIPKQLLRQAFFTEEEYRKTLAFARRTDPIRLPGRKPILPCRPDVARLLVVGWNTGARISDAASLRWADVDFDAGTVTLHPKKRRRVGQTLVIPMTAELRAELEHIRAEQNNANCTYVLPHAQDYLATGEKHFRHCLRKLFRRAGLSPKHRFHSLRHGFATRLLNRGVDSLVVASLTGQTLQVLQGYVHVGMQAKRNALCIGE